MRAQVLEQRLAGRHPDPRSGFMGTVEAVAEVVGDRSTPMFALRLMRRIRPFLRHMVLRKLAEAYPDPLTLERRADHDPAIYADFLNLAERLGVVSRRSGGFYGTPRFVRAGRWVGDPTDAATYEELIALLEQADGPQAPPVFRRRDVRYLVPVLTYARYLDHLRFDQKINVSCEESFFSDLGDLAYELYTGDAFRALVARLDVGSFADIGCGEGAHIADVLDLHPTADCVGYERNGEVAGSAARRFADDDRVLVRHQDFRHAAEDRTFDLVLSSYMLFYLDQTDRARLFEKVARMLAPDGVYVVGQYFPDLDDVQAAFTGGRWWDPTEGYLRRVSSSLLAAEVLLNRILDHFESVVYWPDFLDDLAGAGLEVTEVVPADQFAYSYFVTVRRTGGPRSPGGSS